MSTKCCKYCWWYFKTRDFRPSDIIPGKSKPGNGICYAEEGNFHYVEEDCHCPVYCERNSTNKKMKMTLEDFLRKQRNTI